MSAPQEQHDSDFESCPSDEEVTITEQVEEAIKELPTLEEKVQAIAINYYTMQKRQLDEKLELETMKIEYKIRATLNAEIEEIYALVEGSTKLTKDDYDFILENKDLLKEGELEKLQKIISGEEAAENEGKQIESYWLKCLGTSDIIAEQIHGDDEQVLKNLYRIEGSRNEDNTKLTLRFFFKPNKWFSNQKIEKNFTVNNKQGEVEKSHGDEIEWKEGMNYTMKSVKPNNKKRNKKAIKEKVVKQPSFFHFFTSISSNQEENDQALDEEQWDELMEDLEVQYEISEHIYEDLIPKSLQFYLQCKPEGMHEGGCCGEECHEPCGGKGPKAQVAAVEEEDSDDEDQ